MAFLTKPRARPSLDLDAIKRDHSLASVAGAVVKLRRAGREMKGLCPFHSERSPSFTIFAGGQRFHCFGCGAQGDVLDFVQALHGVGLRDAAEMLGGGELPVVNVAPALLSAAANDDDRSDEARAIWERSIPAPGSLAESYLRSRGLHLPVPEAIRFAWLRYGKSGPDYPALVAAITDNRGEMIGIQRTYLAADGVGKADVSKPKLSLGRVSGGAIQCGPAAGEVILAGGVEDALTCQQELGRVAWATAGETNLGSVALPLFVHTVTLAGDNDEAGRRAVAKATEAYLAQSLTVRPLFPSPDFKDFNAELQEGGRK